VGIAALAISKGCGKASLFPTHSVAAKFKCPHLCKVEMSVVVVRWECGNRRSLAISIFPPLLIFVRVSNN
jgi:hypothetical protein